LGSNDVVPTIELGLPGWCLRAWQRSDAPALARHADNVNVWRWMSDAFPHPYTLEIAEHWVERGHREFGGEHWAIAFEGEAVGGCGIAPRARSAEVGWWLSESHWGRGVATRAARCLVERAFADPGIERIFAPVHDGNDRSMAVARNAGLRLDGVERGLAMKAGRPIDRHLYVRTRDA
jgi:[ribosomal protein S5]-alanine N-acetyltransferase